MKAAAGTKTYNGTPRPRRPRPRSAPGNRYVATGQRHGGLLAEPVRTQTRARARRLPPPVPQSAMASAAPTTRVTFAANATGQITPRAITVTGSHRQQGLRRHDQFVEDAHGQRPARLRHGDRPEPGIHLQGRARQQRQHPYRHGLYGQRRQRWRRLTVTMNIATGTSPQQVEHQCRHRQQGLRQHHHVIQDAHGQRPPGQRHSDWPEPGAPPKTCPAATAAPSPSRLTQSTTATAAPTIR